MRTILTCFAVLCIGVLVSAQEPNNANNLPLKKVELTSNGQTKLKKRFPRKGSSARLYLFRNSRIKKALAFRTKANKAKHT